MFAGWGEISSSRKRTLVSGCLCCGVTGICISDLRNEGELPGSQQERASIGGSGADASGVVVGRQRESACSAYRSSSAHQA